ncbi:MAG TPA: hypothetical protein PK668_04630 [Myxococcota bacterium]|nr:hypothetical protein [Myxococcota bacterium]HRY92146.1 hypothetical protein [Myxococcota bacterium]
MSQASPVSEARIYDQGYHSWSGPRGAVGTRFWIVAWHEIAQAWKNKWFRRVVWIAFFPLGVFSVMLIVYSRLGGFVQAGPADIWIQFWGVQQFFAMLVVYHLGRNAIAEDLRTGALGVYFSRPVSFAQYLGGKWLAVALGVGGVTLAPGLVLAAVQALVGQETGPLVFLRSTAAVVVLSALLAAVEGAVVLAISSLAPRGRVAGIAWVLVFFLSAGLSAALAEGTGLPVLRMVGFPDAHARLAEWLFGQDGFDATALAALASHALWALGGLAIVLARLRRWRGY